MTTSSRQPQATAVPAQKMTPALTFLFAFACGAIAANLYYAQPLIALIGPDVGLSPHVASFIVTLTQIGYGIGLVMLVPLGDVLENKRVIISAVCVTVVALVLITLAPNSALFLVAALLIGVASSAIQMLVPMAASMADEATRGRTVGNVMSGLMVGILFARPLAGFLADITGWRGVFIFSAAMMVGISVLLAFFLPRRHPGHEQGYGDLLASLWHILRDTPELRRRGLYQVALFADFSLFWTAVPLELAAAPFHFSQSKIALFALAGAAGALAAPVAGRLADRGLVPIGTGIAIGGTAVAFAIAGLGSLASSVLLLGLAAVLIDLFVQSNTVFGQRVLYTLSPRIRSRLNGLYIAMFFMGGAAGSALASPLYESFGWSGVVAAGVAFPVIAFAYYLTEMRKPRG